MAYTFEDYVKGRIVARRQRLTELRKAKNARQPFLHLLSNDLQRLELEADVAYVYDENHTDDTFSEIDEFFTGYTVFNFTVLSLYADYIAWLLQQGERPPFTVTQLLHQLDIIAAYQSAVIINHGQKAPVKQISLLAPAVPEVIAKKDDQSLVLQATMNEHLKKVDEAVYKKVLDAANAYIAKKEKINFMIMIGQALPAIAMVLVMTGFFASAVKMMPLSSFGTQTLTALIIVAGIFTIATVLSALIAVGRRLFTEGRYTQKLTTPESNPRLPIGDYDPLLDLYIRDEFLNLSAGFMKAKRAAIDQALGEQDMHAVTLAGVQQQAHTAIAATTQALLMSRFDDKYRMKQDPWQWVLSEYTPRFEGEHRDKNFVKKDNGNDQTVDLTMLDRELKVAKGLKA